MLFLSPSVPTYVKDSCCCWVFSRSPPSSTPSLPPSLQFQQKIYPVTHQWSPLTVHILYKVFSHCSTIKTWKEDETVILKTWSRLLLFLKLQKVWLTESVQDKSTIPSLKDCSFRVFSKCICHCHCHCLCLCSLFLCIWAIVLDVAVCSREQSCDWLRHSVTQCLSDRVTYWAVLRLCLDS